MKVLIETSVFYPAVTVGHPEHEACRELLRAVQTRGGGFVLNTHLIAELYSNLTRIPQLKISPDAARKLLYGLADRFEYVDLDMQDYLRAVDRCADLKLVSGVIFDALHFEAALKAEVDVLYTANLKDFNRFMTEDTPFRLVTPY